MKRLFLAGLAFILALASPQAPATSSRLPPETGGPPRVVTLAPSATELVYAAGAGHYLVGTDRSSDYPPAARAVPRIGDGIQFSDEAVLALHPTLVIGWNPSASTASLASRLERLGIPLLYARPQTLEVVPIWIRLLGARLGTESVADRRAAALEARIRSLPAPSGPSVSVFIEVGHDPLYTLGNDALINALLERCGGRNLYADARLAAPQVSVESVLQRNPDVLIVSPGPGTSLAERKRWWARYGLPAAREGRIHAIDPDWLYRPGPRLVDAAEALCQTLAAP